MAEKKPKRVTCLTCYAEVKTENVDEHEWWHINLNRQIDDAWSSSHGN
jgi:hypothetical protein